MGAAETRTRGAGSHLRAVIYMGLSFKEALLSSMRAVRTQLLGALGETTGVSWGPVVGPTAQDETGGSKYRENPPGFPTTLEHNLRFRTLGLKSSKDSS